MDNDAYMSWKFEYRGSYPGWLCLGGCGTWVYDGKPLLCKCTDVIQTRLKIGEIVEEMNNHRANGTDDIENVTQLILDANELGYWIELRRDGLYIAIAV